MRRTGRRGPNCSAAPAGTTTSTKAEQASPTYCERRSTSFTATSRPQPKGCPRGLRSTAASKRSSVATSSNSAITNTDGWPSRVGGGSFARPRRDGLWHLDAPLLSKQEAAEHGSASELRLRTHGFENAER